jgi:DNA gyrase/topoisomerase IV subunit A
MKRESLVGYVVVSTNDNLLLVTEQGRVKRIPVNCIRSIELGSLGIQVLQFKTATDNLVGVIPQSRTSKVLLQTSKKWMRLQLDSVTLHGTDGIGGSISPFESEEKIVTVTALE